MPKSKALNRLHIRYKGRFKTKLEDVKPATAYSLFKYGSTKPKFGVKTIINIHESGFHIGHVSGLVQVKKRWYSYSELISYYIFVEDPKIMIIACKQKQEYLMLYLKFSSISTVKEFEKGIQDSTGTEAVTPGRVSVETDNNDIEEINGLDDDDDGDDDDNNAGHINHNFENDENDFGYGANNYENNDDGHHFENDDGHHFENDDGHHFENDDNDDDKHTDINEDGYQDLNDSIEIEEIQLSHAANNDEIRLYSSYEFPLKAKLDNWDQSYFDKLIELQNKHKDGDDDDDDKNNVEMKQNNIDNDDKKIIMVRQSTYMHSQVFQSDFDIYGVCESDDEA